MMSRAIAIGICVGTDKVAQVAPGYDYVELTVASTLTPLEDDASFAPRFSVLQELDPPVRSFNVFAPAQLKLVGPSVDWNAVEIYVQRAFHRVQSLGARIVVVGSGGARAVPEGYAHSQAWDQLVRFFRLCADNAATKGITVAIEPLNKRECNIINSFAEGVRMARDVDRAEVRVLADMYHIMVEEEPLDHVLRDADWLAHVHLADSERQYPGAGSWPLDRLFTILRQVGYQGMASIECAWGEHFTEETARALAFLRGLAEKAG